jgi:hypothetical protein
MSNEKTQKVKLGRCPNCDIEMVTPDVHEPLCHIANSLDEAQLLQRRLSVALESVEDSKDTFTRIADALERGNGLRQAP